MQKYILKQQFEGSLYPNTDGNQKDLRDSKVFSVVRDSWSRHKTGTRLTLLTFKNFNGSLVPLEIKNQANLHAGQHQDHNKKKPKYRQQKTNLDAGDSEKEDESAQDCFELLIWHSYSSTNLFASKSADKIGGLREEEQVFLDDLARLQFYFTS
ncbi:hypothetical protein Tco_1223750 [Tanacetum coccineum]